MNKKRNLIATPPLIRKAIDAQERDKGRAPYPSAEWREINQRISHLKRMLADAEGRAA